MSTPQDRTQRDRTQRLAALLASDDVPSAEALDPGAFDGEDREYLLRLQRLLLNAPVNEEPRLHKYYR